jgi:hypothetical protein
MQRTTAPTYCGTPSPHIRTRCISGCKLYLTLRREDLDARFPGLLDLVLADHTTAATARL